MKNTKKVMTTSLLMALMCAAAATMASAKPVKANGQLAVRDVLTADISKDVTGRFVKRQADVEAMNVISDVKAQISDVVDGVRHIRFVAAIDSHMYDQAKFNIVVKNGDEVVKTFADKAVTTAYTHIEANGKVLSAAEAFGDEKYNFMLAYTINNVPAEAWGYTFEATVAIKTAEAEDFTVSEVANKTINKVAFDDAIGAGVVDIVNDAKFPWAMEMVEGVATLNSTNAGDVAKNTEATIKFTAKKDTIVTFDWYVSSEKTYDYLNVKVGSTEVVSRQGNPDGVSGTVYQMLNAGETISFTYRKDSSGNRGEDKAVITNLYFTNGIPSVAITKVFNDGVTPNANATGDLLGTFGDELLVAPENVRGDAYAFDAWYYDAAFTQKANAEDVLTKENITLYANWKEKAVVNFVVPEGATPVEPINVWTYDAIEIDAPSLSKSIFRGWFLDADFNTPIDLANGVTESCTVYAKFEELPLGASKDAAHVIEMGADVHEWTTRAETTEEFQYYYFEFTPEVTDTYIFIPENYSVKGGDAAYNSYARTWIEKADGTSVQDDFSTNTEVDLEAGTTYYVMFFGSKYYPNKTSWGTFNLSVYRFNHDTQAEAIPMASGVEVEIPVGTFTSKYEKIVYKYVATETTGLRFTQESNAWAQVKVYEDSITGSYKLYSTTTNNTKTTHVDVVAGKTYYFVLGNNWNASELAVGEVKFGLYEYEAGYTASNPNEYEIGATLSTDFSGGQWQYFAFNVAAEDVFKLTTTGGESSYTKNVEIYAADDLSKVLLSVSGVNEVSKFGKLPAGNYIMKVYYTNSTALNPFDVAVTVASEGSTPLKPIQATLPGNGEVVAEITAGGYYTFTTGDDSVFHFFTTEDKTVVITILDANGEVIATSTNGQVYNKLAANTTYVLHVDAQAVVTYETVDSIKDGKSADTAFVYTDVTQLPNDSSTLNVQQTIWYEFTATEAGNYAFYSINNGSIDTKAYIYEADGTTEIAYNDDGSSSVMTPLGGYRYDFYIGTAKGTTIELEAGQTVYIKVMYKVYSTSNTSDSGITLNLHIVKE